MKLLWGCMGLVCGALASGCDDPGDGDDAEALCAWSEPHQLFASEPGNAVSNYGPSQEMLALAYASGGALYFSDGEALYTSGPCGEDVQQVPAGDGLRHLHEDLAIDCDTHTVLRGDGSGALVPVRDDVGCDWLVTPEGILAVARPDPEGPLDPHIPLRLIDFRAPELPVMALTDRSITSWAGHVGPRGLGTAGTLDRVLTGHFSSPYVLLTTDGEVLRVDRDTWTTTSVMTDVAELVPSPDGRAFAYRPRLADDTSGELRVHVLAGGEEHVVAGADELADWGFRGPWWSVDGAYFAVVIAGEQPRDRVLTLATGALTMTPPLSHVRRELGAGALWVMATDEGHRAEEREVAWDPATATGRLLYSHAPLPPDNLRATDDALEIVDAADWDGGYGEQPGTLFEVPYDGSGSVRLAEDVYPSYRRLADGRIANIRPTSATYKYGDPVDLVIVDPHDGSEDLVDTSVVPIGPPVAPDGDHETGYMRLIGDLLLYVVRDDAGGRSGVWAISPERR